MEIAPCAGFTGLINLGNTCFMNSCIQILNCTHELKEILEVAKEYNKNIDDDVITESLRELQILMMSNNGTVSPNKFLFHIQQIANKKNCDIFNGFAQNDMPEFLLFIIECVHNSISRSLSIKNPYKNKKNEVDKKNNLCFTLLKDYYKKEYSEIVDLFYAIYVSEISSVDNTEMYTMKPEMYFILDLPLPKNTKINLYNCFDEFIKNELIEGENAWYNEDQKIYQNVQKKITFWSFPKVLVITLKRFSPCGQKKRNDFISIPFNLNLSKYVNTLSLQEYKYNLFGICNHYGGVTDGHYTSTILNSQNEWISFDDTVCEKIEDIDQVITDNAYCLFYRLE
jgi:ubiquitin C-terminal hydrolase